jgi:4-amino-4-deoxy-L-arabinose transferase-like glycosyltransferase
MRGPSESTMSTSVFEGSADHPVHAPTRRSPLSVLSKQLITPRQKALLLLISAIVALLAHVVFLLGLPRGWQLNQSADYATYYEPVAEKLAAGGGLMLASRPALRYPPGIPLLYAATFRVSDTLHVTRMTGLRILEALLITATSVLVSLVAMLIVGWRTALVASALWSTYPFHLWLTRQPDPTSVFSLLLLLSVFLFVRWSSDGRRSVRYGCLLGLVLGIAALIKPIAIALPAVIVGLAWICVIPCRLRHRALFSLCVVVAYLLPLSPWEMWARRVSGQWILLCTNGPSVLIDGLTLGTVRGLKPVSMPQSVRAFTEDAVEHAKQLRTTSSVANFLVAKVQQKPAVVAQFFLIKATRTWYGSESQSFEKWVLVIQLLYLPFVVFGARVLSRGGRQQRNFLLLVTAVTLYFWALTTLTALPVLRYLVPAVSLLMILAAAAFDTVEIQLFQRLFSTQREARIEQERLA